MIAIVIVGGCAYYIIVVAAAQRFVARRGGRQPPNPVSIPFSVLKPLAGCEPELAENLQSFFALDYGDYEILFAARDEDDPALASAQALCQRHPTPPSKVLVAGEPPCPNLKVHSLAVMTRSSSGDVLVISDSDIRADSSLIADLATEFRDPRVGVVTCPYRAAAGRSPWSRLEALGMNTEFWSGVLAAQLLTPMDFAVGPTMAIRRTCLEAIGGWDAFRDFLAEDFQLGRRARLAGYDVRLGTHVVEHRIGSQGLTRNLGHRLRWRRSTRRSRPVGYWGEIFANPFPWALVLPVAASGAAWSWWLLGTCAVLRMLAAIAVGRYALQNTRFLRHCWLVPIQDTLSLAVWVAGLFGKRVTWRDRTYELTRDGRLRPIET